LSINIVKPELLAPAGNFEKLQAATALKAAEQLTRRAIRYFKFIQRDLMIKKFL